MSSAEPAVAAQQIDEYFEELLAAALGHPALSHRFLERFAREALQPEQLIAHATQQYLYSRHFAANLAAVVANVPDEHARTLLVQNMYEEVGEPSRVRDRVHLLVLEAGLVSGDHLASAMLEAVNSNDRDPMRILVERGQLRRADVARIIDHGETAAREITHPALFRRYLHALGLDPAAIANIEPLPETAAFIEEFETLCRRAPWLQSMGALGPGTECIVPSIYTFFLRGIEASGVVRREDYIFWTIHVHADEGHGRNIVTALAPYTRTAEARAAVTSGAMRILDARERWFNGLYLHVFG